MIVFVKVCVVFKDWKGHKDVPAGNSFSNTWPHHSFELQHFVTETIKCS